MFSAKSVGNSSNMCYFQEKCRRHEMSLSLKNVKDGEIYPCAKFRFNFVIVVRNIAKQHFSLKKVLDNNNKPSSCNINEAASSPGTVTRAREKAGSAGLNGKGTNRLAFSLQQSVNTTGTALNDPTAQWAPRSKRKRRLGTRQSTKTL